MSDFIADENDLTGELLRQPQLYNDWAAKAATAKKKESQIYLRRKILKATLYKEAKQRLSGGDAKKAPTGADLEAEVRTNPEYNTVSLLLIEAEEQTALMDAGKWAMVEKSKSLERLCTDRGIGFNMSDSVRGPSVRERGAEIQEQLKEVDKALREGLENKRIRR